MGKSSAAVICDISGGKEVKARRNVEFPRKAESEILVTSNRNQALSKKGSGRILKSLRKYKNKLSILSLESSKREKF